MTEQSAQFLEEVAGKPPSVGNNTTNQFFTFMKKLWKNPKGRGGMLIFAALIGISIYGVFLAPYSPYDVSFSAYLKPSLSHLLGTNYVGEDVFSRFVIGTGTSLVVGFTVAIFTMVVGTLAGVTAGYVGKVTDDVIMRIVDILLVIPGFPLLVILSAYLPPSIWSTIFVLSILSWPFHSRVIRSQTLTLKQRAFVLSSKVSGLSSRKIIMRDIIPNLLPIIFINTIFVVVAAVVAQAGLAFFGLGDLRSVNWGTMLYWFEAQDGILYQAWWWLLPPGVGIMLLGVAANLLSNGVSETTSPIRRY